MTATNSYRLYELLVLVYEILFFGAETPQENLFGFLFYKLSDIDHASLYEHLVLLYEMNIVCGWSRKNKNVFVFKYTKLHFNQTVRVFHLGWQSIYI